MATKKNNATKNTNTSAKKENNAAMEKKIDRLTSEIVAQILANVDLDAIVKKVVAENPAPAKKETEKKAPSKAQIEVREKFAANAKAAAERRNLFRSDEYAALWAEWKTANKAVYDAIGKDRDRKKEMNHAGHLWVMGKLNEAAAPAKAKKVAPKKRATAKRATSN